MRRRRVNDGSGRLKIIVGFIQETAFVEKLKPFLSHLRTMKDEMGKQVIVVKEMNDAIFLEKTNLCPQLLFPTGLNVAIYFLVLAAVMSHGK